MKMHFVTKILLCSYLIFLNIISNYSMYFKCSVRIMLVWLNLSYEHYMVPNTAGKTLRDGERRQEPDWQRPVRRVLHRSAEVDCNPGGVSLRHTVGS